MIPTTRGATSPDDLGFTLMHEHLAIFSVGLPTAFPFLYDRSAIVDKCVADLEAAKSAGVQTIVDVSTADLGRDPELVAEAAERAQMNVVLATGIYCIAPSRHAPRYFVTLGRTPDDAAEVFVREIEEGIGATGIRAGIIKVASHDSVTQEQEVILRGAARAAKATGVPITTHTLATARTGLRQIEVLGEEGVDLSRVAIGHSITTDIEYLRQLYAAGCYVSWDSYLYLDIMPVPMRATATQTLFQLIEEGYAERTVLGHDYYSYADWLERPDEDWTYVSRVVLPTLRSLGASDKAIQQMTVEAPARLLTRVQ